MKRKLAIIGGDLRIAYLTDILKKENWDVKCFGLEEYLFNNNESIHVPTLEELLYDRKIVMSSVPLSKDGKKIRTSFSKKEILIEDVLEQLKNGVFIAGNIPADYLEKYAGKIQFFDLLKEEKLTIQNAVTTVEGAIGKMIERTNRTIYGSKILILGFGRIGKLLANRLQNFGAQIYCEARKQEDLTWIEAYGFQKIALEEIKEINLRQFQMIINTIPYPVLGEKEIERIDPDCYVIDLASAPGRSRSRSNRKVSNTI